MPAQEIATPTQLDTVLADAPEGTGRAYEGPEQPSSCPAYEGPEQVKAILAAKGEIYRRVPIRALIPHDIVEIWNGDPGTLLDLLQQRVMFPVQDARVEAYKEQCLKHIDDPDRYNGVREAIWLMLLPDGSLEIENGYHRFAALILLLSDETIQERHLPMEFWARIKPGTPEQLMVSRVEHMPLNFTAMPARVIVSIIRAGEILGIQLDFRDAIVHALTIDSRELLSDHRLDVQIAWILIHTHKMPPNTINQYAELAFRLHPSILERVRIDAITEIGEIPITVALALGQHAEIAADYGLQHRIIEYMFEHGLGIGQTTRLIGRVYSVIDDASAFDTILSTPGSASGKRTTSEEKRTDRGASPTLTKTTVVEQNTPPGKGNGNAADAKRNHTPRVDKEPDLVATIIAKQRTIRELEGLLQQAQQELRQATLQLELREQALRAQREELRQMESWLDAARAESRQRPVEPMVQELEAKKQHLQAARKAILLETRKATAFLQNAPLGLLIDTMVDLATELPFQNAEGIQLFIQHLRYLRNHLTQILANHEISFKKARSRQDIEQVMLQATKAIRAISLHIYRLIQENQEDEVQHYVTKLRSGEQQVDLSILEQAEQMSQGNGIDGTGRVLAPADPHINGVNGHTRFTALLTRALEIDPGFYDTLFEAEEDAAPGLLAELGIEP